MKQHWLMPAHLLKINRGFYFIVRIKFDSFVAV